MGLPLAEWIFPSFTAPKVGVTPNFARVSLLALRARYFGTPPFLFPGSATELPSLSLQICAEETMNDILKRYLPYNSHASSYTWKYFGQNLDMNKTLLENGINDESEDFFELRMDEDEFLPPISLYFNDDLTES